MLLAVYPPKKYMPTVSETAGAYADSASRYVGEATRFASERRMRVRS